MKPLALWSDNHPLSNPTLFQSIVGTLQYFTLARLDLSLAVNSMCQHMHAPIRTHFQMMKQIVQYVKGTLHLIRKIQSQSSRE